jgi:hypothetical protein
MIIPFVQGVVTVARVRNKGKIDKEKRWRFRRDLCLKKEHMFGIIK